MVFCFSDWGYHNFWPVQFDVKAPESGVFNFVFETKTSDSSEIIAAVDNLSITNGSCLSIGMFYVFKGV